MPRLHPVSIASRITLHFKNSQTISAQHFRLFASENNNLLRNPDNLV